MTCPICHGEKRVKVGVSFPPRKTIAFKVEYDLCPGCTPGPHTFHAKKVGQALLDAQEPTP